MGFRNIAILLVVVMLSLAPVSVFGENDFDVEIDDSHALEIERLYREREKLVLDFENNKDIIAEIDYNGPIGLDK